MPVLGETEAIARERLEYINSLVHPEVGLSTLSSHSGIDLSAFPLDTKYSDIIASLGDAHIPTMLRMFSTVAGGGEDLTLADLGRRYGTNVGFVPQWAGTPTQIADALVEHFDAGAADGFIISAAYLPGVFEDFVVQVVPVLQERGVFRDEYEGATLRDHLGLELPSAVNAS
jgi:alkanesulfonate monooxygenase SsuD/methylene tetrahydromethanopterin reductase-like flavin-dependent oxidoreductase (luciferase family)